MTRIARNNLRARRAGWLSGALLDAALDAALTAHRVGTLAALCKQHPRLARGLLRRFAAPSLWFLRSQEATELAWAVGTFVGWLMGQARPDGLDAAQLIPRHAWLGSAAWRALLAVMAHNGFATVPSFPERYRARDGEPAFEHLCGLWEVAPSSFYRYVERGREQLIAVALQVPADTALPALCEHFQQAVFRRESADDTHVQRLLLQAARAAALDSRAYDAALWYAVRTGNVDAVSLVMERGCNELAAGPVVDPLLKRFEPADASEAALVRFRLAHVSLARVRGQTEQEQQHLDEALRIASRSGDPVLLGDVYGARGRHVEPRDVDRAIADYNASIEHYEPVARDDDGGAGAERTRSARVGLLTSLVRLAYLYLRRGDPRCKALLERANDVRASCDAPLDVQAMIESAWGEQRQRERDTSAAIEALLRALLLYERSGNRQQMLRVQASLVSLYGKAKDAPKALEYARLVFAFAESGGVVEPQSLSATHLNLGIAYFWDAHIDEALHHYQQALAIATQASLKTLMGRAHFNLAELFYKRFQMQGQPQDEQHGDTHVGLSKAIWALGGDKAAGEATSNLKRTMLGQQDQLMYERMLPGELAAHFDEMSEIQTQRLRLGMPTGDADEQIRAHLRIAQAYTRIAVKEREAAVALMHKQGRGERFAAELRGLKTTFEQALTQESVIAARWQGHAGCPVALEQIEAVIRHGLQEAGLTKSGYASLCRVSPATASKHLAALAQLGLLEQAGRGPATRYLVVQTA
jgi:tetratricopeptide (TPR) repeat protein